MKRVFIVSLLIVFVAINSSCGRKKTAISDSTLSGNLIIFHAGSLSMPFKAIADSFMQIHPNVKVLCEASGSIDAARKITELKRECDIMASADYSIIDKLLVPQYASRNSQFASNEMAIVYTERSAHADKIDTSNWAQILLRDDVIIGRADPDADPCGYRSVLTLKLAEKDFAAKGAGSVGLAEKIMAKDNRFMRPKEVDLLALLDTRTVDYIFLYRSVAVQHNLKYLTLPRSINLGDPTLNPHYAGVQTIVRGSKPGEKLTMKGEAMVYGVTILDKAPNRAAAEAFVEYLLSEEGAGKSLKQWGRSRLQKNEIEVKYDSID